jgi:hypothetical protein
MSLEEEFAIFAQDEKGPMWREALPDLDTAKVKAKRLAMDEGVEFFVFSFKDAREVARFFPKPTQGTPKA